MEDKQNYIDSVISIPDSSQDLLKQFQKNLQIKIRKEQFDSVLENLIRLGGAILSKYCDGKTEIGDSKIKLPPL